MFGLMSTIRAACGQDDCFDANNTVSVMGVG